MKSETRGRCLHGCGCEAFKRSRARAHRKDGRICVCSHEERRHQLIGSTDVMAEKRSETPKTVKVPTHLVRVARAFDELRDAVVASLSGRRMENGILYTEVEAVPGSKPEPLDARIRQQFTDAPHRRGSLSVRQRDAIERSAERRAVEPKKKPEGLSPCEFAILGVLAERHPKTTTQRQVAIRAGYRQSGTFTGSITSLRQAGYLQGSRSDLLATAEGIALAPAVDRPKPGPKLVAWWVDELGGGGNTVARILDVLARAYPTAMTKEQVAEHTNNTLSGTFTGGFTKLSALGLIETRGRGMYRVVSDIMEAT